MQMTLVEAGGRCWEDAIARGNVAVAGIVGRIKGLGLGVALRKTEAIFFHDGSQGAPPRLSVRVDRHRVEVGAQMRYLGLHLDGRWNFGEHFARLAPKMVRVAASLSRLLRNLGGPAGRPQVVCGHSRIGGPLRGSNLGGCCLGVQGDRGVFAGGAHRPIVLRAARAYRTASYAVAALLAGAPPLELLA